MRINITMQSELLVHRWYPERTKLSPCCNLQSKLVPSSFWGPAVSGSLESGRNHGAVCAPRRTFPPSAVSVSCVEFTHLACVLGNN